MRPGNGNGNGNGHVPPVPEAAVGEDVALVNASIGGSLGAFEELYTRYFPKVRAFCYRKTGNPELAQDITQEAFARAFERIDGFGGPKRFGSWVGTIAANLVTDHYRRKSTSDVPLDPAVDGDRLPSEDVDPLANIERENTRSIVRPALEKLKPRQREALLLHEIEGLSCAAVGQRFGISEGAAESLVARGRRKLRREILTKATPDELLGMGAIGPMVPVWRTWGRARDGVARKASWLQHALARGADSLGVGAIPAGQAAKALALVVGTALALDAAAALVPVDKPRIPSKPAAVVEGAANHRTDEGRPTVADSMLGKLGARKDFEVDPRSGRAEGSVQGSVEPPGETSGNGGANYSFHFEGDPDQGGAGARVYVNDPDGNPVADTGDQTFGW